MSITESQELASVDEADDFSAESYTDEMSFAEIDTYHSSRRAHRAATRASKTGAALAAAIAQIAEQEYQRWRPGGGRSLVETDPAATPILQDYYRTGVGLNVGAIQLQNTQWQNGHPWSAVFVSWVMRHAGAGTAFAYSAAHQTYIRAARRNRLASNAATPFWAFRVTEVAPQLGDLVCTARGNSAATYDNIGDPQSRKTHCDVVTAVRPGEIRVIGGNVRQNVDTKTLRTGPDGRLRTDGNQSQYFAIIKCNAAVAVTPPPPTPRTAPQVRANQHVVENLSLLREHAGAAPDMVLKWNDMAQPANVDVVVHLHGWSPGVGRRMNIVRHKLPVSGLDFADPKRPSSVGRTAPTLMILPRGHHDPIGKKTERYTFPALVKPRALQRLIDDALGIFSAQTGVTVGRRRLILTAHSGGGAALMKILEHSDPDEVHTFDALYTDPRSLISWAQRRMSAGGGALRVIYRPGEETAPNSKRVARAISESASPAFRVERTTVSHNDIPSRFGWRLLADSSADLSGALMAREADDEAQFASGETRVDEFDEDHAEEAAVHGTASDHENAADEFDEDESYDIATLTELIETDRAYEIDSGELPFPDDSPPSHEMDSEEFGGSEHKHLGDRASGGESSLIPYGSPIKQLSYGDVVALAGDYFATYTDLHEISRTDAGRQELDWARWDCLGLRAACVPEPPASLDQKRRVRNRYFGLASRNISHFSAGGTARITYLEGHWKALADALEAGQTGSDAVWRRALSKEAFADHFLTDAFSAGHIRTPRAAIRQWYGTHMPESNDALIKYLAQFMFYRLDERQKLPTLLWWIGEVQRWILGGELLEGEIRKTGGEAARFFSLGDIISLALHNYDNKGLDVVSDVDAGGRAVTGGFKWRAVGDGHLGVSRTNKQPCAGDCDCATQTRHGRPDTSCAAECACKPPPGNPHCAAAVSAASADTSTMAAAAVTASLRDLEQTRGLGRKLGNKRMTAPQKVQHIRSVTGAVGSSALAYLPREDASSRRNAQLSSASPQRRAAMEWRWGQLGDDALRAVDETVRCQIADELGSLICNISDPAVKDIGGVIEFRLFGTRNAFRAFLRHLREDGIKAIELAIGKAAR